MKLERFRISNFRSINDSGSIGLADTTALVGRNESGKTNLLQALASLNDGASIQPLLTMFTPLCYTPGVLRQKTGLSVHPVLINGWRRVTLARGR